MNLSALPISGDWLLNGLLRATWQASVLAAVVLLIQFALGRRLGGRGRHMLWSVVVLRLLLPWLPPSPLSVFNLANPVQVALPIASSPEVPVIRDIQPAARESAPVVAERTGTYLAIPTRAKWTWQQTLLTGWIAGMASMTLWIVVRTRSWRRTLGKVEAATNPQLLDLVMEAAEIMSIRRMPRIMTGQDVRTPAVVGVFRPALLMPSLVLERCKSEELRMIVLHELAHVKRNDIAANWLVAVGMVIHWFNPIIWLVAARIRADRELACDETVLAHCPAPQARAYGQTLLRLIEILTPSRADRHPQLVGILESSGPLQRRMRMIAQYTPQSSRRWIFVTLILMALGCTWLTDAVQGQARPSGLSASPATRPAGGNAASAGTEADAEPTLQVVIQTRKLPEIRFDQTELTKVVDFLRDVTGTNIFVNWRALETAGIDKESKVTLQLRSVSFGQALKSILRDVGGGAVRLDYVVEDNVLVITTEEDAASDTETQFYDVSDLLLSSAGDALTGKERTERVDSLISVIQDTAARDSWRDNGGSVGSVREFNNKLIISQTTRAHQQIQDLLTRLREKPTTQPSRLAAKS